MFSLHLPCLSVSCMNPRDKVHLHLSFWSFSVAQFNNSQCSTPSNPHSWPSCALAQPFQQGFYQGFLSGSWLHRAFSKGCSLQEHRPVTWDTGIRHNCCGTDQLNSCLSPPQIGAKSFKCFEKYSWKIYLKNILYKYFNLVSWPFY